MDVTYSQYDYIPLTYDAQYVGREDLQQDIVFYKELAAEAGGRVCEVGCGTGRVYLPIRRSGIDVWGVDLSDKMLDVLRAKALKEGLECKLFQGDARTFTLKRKFRIVTMPFRVFQHLLSPQDQLQALANIREHLLPGGRLALNLFNPNMNRLVNRCRQPLYEGSFAHPVTGRTVHLWSSTSPDWDRQVAENQMIYEEVDAQGKVVDRRVIPLWMRWTYRHEFEHLAARAGFTVEALHGDFWRSRFTGESPEQVWVLKK